MNTNTIGTILRVMVVFFILISIWYFVSNIIYFIAIVLFGLDFDFIISMYILFFIFLFRAFYPKNVFK